MRNRKIPVKDSLQSNDAARAGYGNSSLLRRNGEIRQTCAHCQAEIVDGHWFSRLPGNEGPTLLCSPSCALHYFDRLHIDSNGSDEDWESPEPRFDFLIDEERL